MRKKTDGTFKSGQRVRIKDNCGIRYGVMSLDTGELKDMKSASGLEGVLIEYDVIDDMFGGSRWIFKADNGREFHLCVGDFELINPAYEPGQSVVWHYESNRGWGIDAHITCTVVRQTPKRVLIEVPMKDGSKTTRWVTPAKLKANV